MEQAYYAEVTAQKHEEDMQKKRITLMTDHNRTQETEAVQQKATAEESEYQMPEEFNEDDVAPDSTAQPNFLTVDAMNSDRVYGNIKQYEEDHQRMNAPVGDWEKNSRWIVTTRIQMNDSQPNDFDSRGRTIYSVMGRPKPRSVGDIEHAPMLFARISPDRRFKQDKPNEFDNAYKLFNRARELYIALHYKDIASERDFITFLAEDEAVYRTMKGYNGPVVVDIKAVRRPYR